MSIFIDSSIFLRLLLNESGTDLAQNILENVEANKIIAYTTPMVLEEISFKLIYAKASELLETVNIWRIREEFKLNNEFRSKCIEPIEKFLKYIEYLSSRGLRIESITYKDWIESVEIGRKYGLFPADSIHVAIVMRIGIDTIATFDSDFKRVKDIKVIP